MRQIADTMQHTARQHLATEYDPIRHRTAKHNTTNDNTLRHGATEHDTIQQTQIQYNAIFRICGLHFPRHPQRQRNANKHNTRQQNTPKYNTMQFPRVAIGRPSSSIASTQINPTQHNTTKCNTTRQPTQHNTTTHRKITLQYGMFIGCVNCSRVSTRRGTTQHATSQYKTPLSDATGHKKIKEDATHYKQQTLQWCILHGNCSFESMRHSTDTSQHNTRQRNTTQYNTPGHNTTQLLCMANCVWRSIFCSNAIQTDTPQYNAISNRARASFHALPLHQCNADRQRTTLNTATQHDTMQQTTMRQHNVTNAKQCNRTLGCVNLSSATLGRNTTHHIASQHNSTLCDTPPYGRTRYTNTMQLDTMQCDIALGCVNCSGASMRCNTPRHNTLY